MARKGTKAETASYVYAVFQAPLLKVAGGADINHPSARFLGYAANGGEAEKLLKANPAVHPLYNFISKNGEVDVSELYRLTILREQQAKETT